MTSTNAATVRDRYAQVMGPGCLEDPASIDVAFTLRDGSIVRYAVLEDPGAALAAAGSTE